MQVSQLEVLPGDGCSAAGGKQKWTCHLYTRLKARDDGQGR